MMIPLLHATLPHPYLEKSQKTLDDFSCVGLRTLVFGCRIITQSQFDEFSVLYNEAITSSKKKEKLNALCRLVENSNLISRRRHVGNDVVLVLEAHSERKGFGECLCEVGVSTARWLVEVQHVHLDAALALEGWQQHVEQPALLCAGRRREGNLLRLCS